MSPLMLLKHKTMVMVVFLMGGLLFAHASDLYAQHEISGTVTSAEDAQPLPGVTILVEGTTIGTTTGIDGEYALTAPSDDATLMISYVGFQSEEIAIEGRSTIDLALTPALLVGDEIVVVGYGVQQRSDITGSVSSLSADDLQERVSTLDMGEALQGRVSGVTALSSGGRPGQGVTIRVRGRRSLTASNDPLFVVDGIPLEGGIDDINHRDIQSMEVLKDASATAIYGSRGANGVILVTTNRGGNHPTQVSYSAHGGFSRPHGTPDMMNAEEFAEFQRVSGRGLEEWEEENLARGVDFDWVDLVMENGFEQSHQLSIRGGDANTQFALSGNFTQETSVVPGIDFSRQSFRVNLDHTVADMFRVGLSSQLSRRNQDWGTNPYGTALSTNPIAEPWDEDGELMERPSRDDLIWNVLLDLEEGNYIDERRRYRIFTNIFAELDISPNLQYRMNFGPDYRNSDRGLFQGSRHGSRAGSLPLAQKDASYGFTYTFENILTYQQEFEDIHSVNFTGLFSIQESVDEWSTMQADRLPYEHQQFHNLGTAGRLLNADSNLEEWGLMSFMGRANYQYDSRYLLTLTGRYDGSSRLAEEHRWGFFPSVALGWNIDQESFMDDQTLFSELRLRTSYGIAGNTAVAPYRTHGALARTTYSFEDNEGFGFRPTDLSNPDLRWETSATANIGIDYGLLQGRIAGSFEVYQTNTTDLLLERQIPITSGFNSVLENIGETVNRGFEVDLNTINILTDEFSWTTDFNISGNREEIVDLYGDGRDDIGNQWFIGEPLTVWYDYDKIGIWQLDEAAEAEQYGQVPGEIKVRDVNGDGRITDEDRAIIGTDMPTLTGGMTNRFRYRGISLSVELFGSFGHTIYNNFEVSNATMVGRYNNLNVDYWTEDNPTNAHPRPDHTLEFPLYGSSRGYMPGDFLKIRNIQLGYNMPASVTESMGIRSARIYLNADQPFVFSHLDQGIDPEQYGGYISSDIPSTRTFTAGVDISF